MKPAHGLVTLAFAAVVCLIPTASGIARQTASKASDQLSSPANTRNETPSAVDAIHRTPDPSTAVAAYTSAISHRADYLAVTEAYVRRMVELGVPEMAYTQARDLSRRQPNNGLAWAVVADADGRRGEPAAALTAIAVAFRHTHSDLFVQGTAGQLLAWYDVEGSSFALSDALKAALEIVRKDLAGQSAFTEGYQRAHDFYERAKAGEDLPPSPEDSAAVGVASEPTEPQPDTQPPPTADYGETPAGATKGYVPPSNTYIYQTYEYPYYGYPCYPYVAGFGYYGYSGPYGGPRDFGHSHDRNDIWWGHQRIEPTAASFAARRSFNDRSVAASHSFAAPHSYGGSSSGGHSSGGATHGGGGRR